MTVESYQGLNAELAKLKKAAVVARRKELKTALAQARKLIKAYGITKEELMPKPMPQGSGSSGGEAAGD